jgi:hypothetical protein
VPAEGIHLSALADTRAGADGAIERLLRVHERAARLGAVLVDLPYFERFPVELLRYVAKRPPQPSRWGDILHRSKPARVGLELLRAARAARRDDWLGLALGYLSHAAVDRAIHPLVNRLARARAAALGSTEAQQHREVEKFQSVLFHERRLGRDLMGTPHLTRYIAVDGALLDGALGAALASALRAATGEAPPPGAWAAWAAGYAQYVGVLGSPLGRLPAPPSAKERERPALYDAVAFDGEYARAMARSRRDVTTGYALLEAGRLDGDEYFAAIPEGSIDGDAQPPSPAAS